MEAEREAVAMYRAYLMRDQVGQRFEGVVSAVTSFGAFVELEEPYVEGLIKLDSLGNEPFAFDEVHMRLSGQRTGTTISLGDKVTVEINNVSVVRRRIDFTLIAAQTAGRKVRRAPEQPGEPARAEPRVGLARRKKAGREVERAIAAHVEPGARPRRAPAGAGAGGKLRLGVSHRGPHDDGGRKKPGKRRK
jgi:ribonuclease R